MSFEKQLFDKTAQAIHSLYGTEPTPGLISFQETRKEFAGDITLVVFPIAKLAKRSPDQAAQEIGAYLRENVEDVADFNVVKGFLNIVISDRYWLKFFNSIKYSEKFGIAQKQDGRPVLLEYSSPNTNKPLHLGHVRNNLLGYSVAEILKANGRKVIKVNLVNDRGIHICKSMLAWQKWGNGVTPQSSGKKGDHLVGDFYVMFDKELKKQMAPVLEQVYSGELGHFNKEEREKLSALVSKRADVLKAFGREREAFDPSQLGVFDAKEIAHKDSIRNKETREETIKEKSAAEMAREALAGKRKFKDLGKMLEKVEKPDSAQKEAIKQVRNMVALEDKVSELEDAVKEIAQLKTTVMKEAQDMLRKWEAGDKETIETWRMMNSWVYEGFDVTYRNLGVDFDKIYNESETYIRGKQMVQEGLGKGVFFKKEDGSVWIDLKEEGLDEKLLLRKDGTSVYITQDLGTAAQRNDDYPGIEKMIYTVGNEQEHHFKVLQAILKRLGYDWADGVYHLSYGMVELPSGKMKSREGTVVDADDLMAGMIEVAESIGREHGKINLEEFSGEEIKELFTQVGLAALKYFILKVDPKKKMLFNPEESIDFNGNTGPFIQYNYVRTRALLRNQDKFNIKADTGKSFDLDIAPEEKSLIMQLYKYPSIVKEAGEQYSPALIANYAYDLAKEYSQYYHAYTVFKAGDEKLVQFRLAMGVTVGNVLRSAMGLLGISMPERM
jgi:arginyl-tRNA synthetase